MSVFICSVLTQPVNVQSVALCVIADADELRGLGFSPGSSNMMMWNYTHAMIPGEAAFTSVIILLFHSL